MVGAHLGGSILVEYTIKMLQRAADDFDNVYNHISDDFKKIIIFHCIHQHLCYNVIRKGNRHRVVDLDEKRKPFPHSPKYREGFVMLVTNQVNECQQCQ